jgi:hypothetical protein
MSASARGRLHWRIIAAFRHLLQKAFIVGMVIAGLPEAPTCVGSGSRQRRDLVPTP